MLLAMKRSSLYFVLLIWVTVFCLGLEAKDIKRSKRQFSVTYVCGNAPNTFVSQNPCQYQNYGCGQRNCNNNYNNYQQNPIIPQYFYNPGTNCYNSCNNFNCNNYNGQYMNGQYVAYQRGSNQYSPCASSCCRFTPQPIQFIPTLHDSFSSLWGLNNWRRPVPATPLQPLPGVPSVADMTPYTISTDPFNPYNNMVNNIPIPGTNDLNTIVGYGGVNE